MPHADTQPKTSKKGEKPSRSIDLERVSALAEPVVVAHGLELVEVEWVSTHHGQVLRVIIERPLDGEQATEPAADGLAPIAGVDLGDCVSVSRDLSTVLDVEEPIDAKYTLEVSSPGLDRPLKTARDYRRQIGRLAKIKLVEPAEDGQMVLRGIIQRVLGDDDDPRVEMLVDGNAHDVALSNVQLSKLVFELPSQPKKGQPKKGRADKRSKKGRQSKRGTR